MKENWLTKDNPWAEALIAGLCLVSFVGLLHETLLTGQGTMAHDNLRWVFPIFHHALRSFSLGELPLWNPFSHMGEPFYPLLGQIRLLEPFAFLYFWVGTKLSSDSLLLFHWHRFILSTITCVGLYLFLRRYCASQLVRLSLIPAIFLSSVALGHYRQDGILHQFLWAPYIAILLRSITHDFNFRWSNWFFLSALVGLSCQSYWFSGAFLFVSFWLLFTILFRDRNAFLVALKQYWLRPIFALGIIALMMLPNLALVIDGKRVVHPLRMADAAYEKFVKGEAPPSGGVSIQEAHPDQIVKDLILPYKMVEHTGTSSRFLDILHMISPNGSVTVHKINPHNWGGPPGEAYLYFGLIGFALLLLGIIFGAGSERRFWLGMLATYFFLILGPKVYFLKLLYYVFPPMWFVRHSHCFTLYFALAVLYFIAQGLNVLSTQDLRSRVSFRSLRFSKLFPWVVLLVIALWGGSRLFGYPENRLTLVILAICSVIIGAVFRKHGKTATFAVILSSFLLVPVLYHRVLYVYLAYTLVALSPIIFILYREKTYQSGLFLLLVGIWSLDLAFGIRSAEPIYSNEIPPIIENSRTLPSLSNTSSRDIAGPSTIVGQPGLVEGRNYAFGPPLPRPVWAEQPSPFDSIKSALEGPRVGGFVLTQAYFRMIYSKLSPEQLGLLLAIETPEISLKTEVKNITEEELYKNLAAFNPQQTREILEKRVYVHSELAHAPTPAKTAQLRKPSIKVLSKKSTELQVEVTNSNARALYWSNGFDPNWKAWVDGQEVPVVRANVNGMAIALPKGTSQVRFQYRPTLFLSAMGVYYAVFFLMFLLGILSYRRDTGS